MVNNTHLEQGRIIQLNGTSNLTIMVSEIKVFRPIAGNVKSDQDQTNIEFSCDPIQCRKKAKKDSVQTKKRNFF